MQLTLEDPPCALRRAGRAAGEWTGLSGRAAGEWTGLSGTGSAKHAPWFARRRLSTTYWCASRSNEAAVVRMPSA